MLSFDFIGIELLWRKVLQVLRDDDIGSAPDCGGQNMPVIGIGKAQTIDKWVEAHHQRIGEMPIHCLPGSLELIGAEVGPVIQHVPHPFFVDHSAPASAIKISVGETQKGVAKAGGVDDIGIQKRREPIHPLLKAKLFIELGQFVEYLTTRPFGLAPVGENVFGPHSPVRANFSVWNFLLVEKLHEMRPRDIEQVSRLLRGQLGMDRHKCHRVAARHLLKDIKEQPHRDDRQLYV